MCVCACACALVCLCLYTLCMVKVREMCLAFTIDILIRISIAMIKTMTKSIFRRKMFISPILCFTSKSIVHHREQSSKQEPWGGMLFKDFLLRFLKPDVDSMRDKQPRDATPYSKLDPCMSVINQENIPHSCLWVNMVAPFA